MTTITGAWSEIRLEDFLEESRVPIRLATHRGDGSLWMVALWYRYRNGSLECATWSNAHIVRYLESDPEVAFDISTNQPPYRGVRGNGTATLSTDRAKATLEALIERYLGDTESALAEWLLHDAREEMRIRVQPNEMYSWDYTDRMRDLGDSTP
ncbi:pyridoxamine 5'-phosphate oxidase family protein [Halomicroarcula limicola]|uniref:Pyridoxamine 5'-phosphate oxidase family protein n=1 Tax=Haloarcula limicola TaxID=1429915 RepID=A0A8J7YDM5_9EURY|nr:pyridoxamine 5'-phosphate oxidase family protein [Halomicroarcula limicola]MBV0925281.1 pyridoxamine 5'-phosphate oxidase family protein [Halomicroarcula limicola]